MKRKPKRPRHKKRARAGEPQVVTRAVTHIRLVEVNPGKLAALDELAPIYLALCQQYVDLFCTKEIPNNLRIPLYATPLSERWHRVAIMQAAGIARSWRTNRQREYQEFQKKLATYREQQVEVTAVPTSNEPTWREWNIPLLRETAIQANVNVVVCEPSTDSVYDYWLRVSTLAKGKPLYVPVKLAPYHRNALNDKKLNSSVQLNQHDGGWWLTLSYDETVTVQTPPDAPVVGIDVGMANFLTTSTGKQYGTMHGKRRSRHRRDREKRRRKAKLRACLQKKHAKKLPTTASRSGHRLMRSTKQAINRAVKQCITDTEHQGVKFAYEQLSVASMRIKAKAMNSYLRASNLAHIPRQIAWNGTKRGVLVTPVSSAYSSQECSRCHFTHRGNRVSQGTFHCLACGYEAHADKNASVNISRRVGDTSLRACTDRNAIKALLMKRHEQWKMHDGKGSIGPLKQRKRLVSSGRT